MKILNLYAGLGGNRTNWDGHEVHSVELDGRIATVYHDRFPNDYLYVDDAHEFLLENYSNFDLIWSSPPCQTHSSFRQNICVRFRGTKPVYPDMKLYQEILFLKYNFKGMWVVENVKPYYDPLIPISSHVGRHYVWTSGNINSIEYKPVKKLRSAQIPDLQEYHGIDLSGYKLKNKRQLLRNCVDADVGAYILNSLINGGNDCNNQHTTSTILSAVA